MTRQPRESKRHRTKQLKTQTPPPTDQSGDGRGSDRFVQNRTSKNRDPVRSNSTRLVKTPWSTTFVETVIWYINSSCRNSYK